MSLSNWPYRTVCTASSAFTRYFRFCERVGVLLARAEVQSKERAYARIARSRGAPGPVAYRDEPASSVPKTIEFACLFISAITHMHVFKATLVEPDAETLPLSPLVNCGDIDGDVVAISHGAREARPFELPVL